jgi:hypothetical protein
MNKQNQQCTNEYNLAIINSPAFIYQNNLINNPPNPLNQTQMNKAEQTLTHTLRTISKK